MKKKENKPRETSCHLKVELFCAKIIFLLMLTLAMAVLFSFLLGCAGMRLPNRDHPACTIPYSQRPVCLTNANCSMGYLCSFRSGPLGRCTYEDCCNPWRNRRLERGDSFCNGEIRNKPSGIRKPCHNQPNTAH